LDGPERELLSFLEIGIFQVNKIQAAIVTRTDVWFVLTKYQSIKGAPISRNLNPYDNVILVALPLDSQNLCGDGRQWCFLGLKFPDYVSQRQGLWRQDEFTTPTRRHPDYLSLELHQGQPGGFENNFFLPCG